VTASPADFAGLTPAPAQARVQQAAAPEARTKTAPEARTKTAEVKTDTATPEAKALADAKTQAAPVEARVQIASVEPPPAESAEKTETTSSVSSEAILPVSTTPRPEPETLPLAPVGPPLEIAPSDAKVFRERGVFAYRSGDLYGAIAEFDRAIQIDPKFSAAYVDRGIVLYRLQQFERAFADIAHAKRIEKTKRGKVAQADGKKKGPQAAVFPPFFQRRTAKLE
jgi:tetratricopeptide (TPR) repeat protein